MEPTHSALIVPVPEAEQLDRVLDDDQVRRVARLAVMSEQHYGVPQDTEFAFEDGELYIVQTRPITTLAVDAAHAADPVGAGGEVEPIVSGLGAGPGTAIGTARVLTELADGVNLAAGEILVATMTDPDWLLRLTIALA